MNKCNIRNGYTMIELIFVIVIIGILAAVAIPKLAATRKDAELSTLVRQIASAATEIAAYAVSQGKTETDFAQMSNTLYSMSQKSSASLSDLRADIVVSGISDCISIVIEGHDTNIETLKVIYGSSSNEDCDTARSLINSSDYPIPLRGSLIKY